MKLSAQAREESGAEQVSAMMGTARNKELFLRSGLSAPEVEAARTDDLVVAARGEGDLAEKALAVVRRLLDEAPARKKDGRAMASAPQSLDQALATDPGINLALISVAGDYARYEAARALNAGLDVMLYSDNISIDDELMLKKLAQRKGLLVMGPDCGTAFINGVPLAFANAVRRGSVGLVGASGTGLQEVMCLLDRLGAGVSHAYGTGGRDLKDAVGGITALAALDRLAEDPGTRVIGLIAKPPGDTTRKKILERAKSLGKPVVVHFLGATEYAAEDAAGIGHAGDLTAFACLLAGTAECGSPSFFEQCPPVPEGKGGYLRGLFSGGSLCQEAAELAAPMLRGEKCSNLLVAGFERLGAADASRGHVFLDFGDDEFTVGRPHPMMAPELRMDRLVREMCDPATGAVLIDLVIGHGAASGQAELVAKALEDAAARSGGKSREKYVVASVCGTEGDVPSRSAQAAVLSRAGVFVLGSNAKAAVWAAKAVSEAARGGKA